MLTIPGKAVPSGSAAGGVIGDGGSTPGGSDEDTRGDGSVRAGGGAAEGLVALPGGGSATGVGWLVGRMASAAATKASTTAPTAAACTERRRSSRRTSAEPAEPAEPAPAPL
ncbi:hypothetical protein ACTMTJ_43835, partial [Phytohabitans sp. LJ34]